MKVKTKHIKNKVKRGFIPHSHNNYRPRIIRHRGLALVLVLLLGLQLIYNYSNSGQIKVLGYATNVSSSALLEYTNQNRSDDGLSELSLNEDLSKAAQLKAEHMVANNYWSHYAPDGTTPWDFINKTGYGYLKAGENLAYGFTDSAGTVRGWMDSPPHAANIMDPKFQEVGFGTAHGANFQGDENTVVVAMYGQPIDGVADKSGQSDDKEQALSWSPQEVIRSDQADTQIVQPAAKQINVLSAVTSGQAHWSLYASISLLLMLGVVYAIRHTIAIRQFATHGEHLLDGHPMLEAALIYGLIWLILASTYGVIQ